jgi:hypothetical protein
MRASASTSGPAELPARSWPGSTRGSWSRSATFDIRQGDLVDTFARSKSEDTRRKAAKFGAMGSTIRATKPRRER